MPLLRLPPEPPRTLPSPNTAAAARRYFYRRPQPGLFPSPCCLTSSSVQILSTALLSQLYSILIHYARKRRERLQIYKPFADIPQTRRPSSLIIIVKPPLVQGLAENAPDRAHRVPGGWVPISKKADGCRQPSAFRGEDTKKRSFPYCFAAKNSLRWRFHSSMYLLNPASSSLATNSS